MLERVSDKVVCLGCGLIVGGPGAWGCACPPPSIAPRSGGKPAGPYRSLPESAPCPRCSGRLLEASFHDVTVLDCADCRGLFLSREVIDALAHDARLRLAFPERERVPEPPVRYLSCPLCSKVMNRENFGTMSGVLVDVCLDDGIWFDAGEINAVIDFVEKGGLERANARKEAERSEQKLRLAEQLRTEQKASAMATPFQPRGFVNTPGGAVLGVFSRWLLNR